MNKSIKIIGTILSTLVIFLGLLLLSDAFFIGVVKVEGSSMQGVVDEGDQVVINHFGKPSRFDVVLVQTPEQSETAIRRVIGLPGEKIEYIQNKLYVNGEAIAETFLPENTKTSYFSSTRFFPTDGGIIPAGKYIVINDNRQDMQDSRSFGAVEESDIQGISKFRVYPFNKFGSI